MAAAAPRLALAAQRISRWGRQHPFLAPSWLAAAQRARYLSSGSQKPIFFDMVHSNNAARIRLWLMLSGVKDKIDTRMVTYPDLQSEEFKKVNPLKKVPAFINEVGEPIFESAVILNYLEDKYEGELSQSFLLPTPEQRAYVHLLIRMHDLYIASPNCTQPGFSHTQGSMYLGPYPTPWCLPERAMDRATRAAKIAEIWKQLGWLEEHVRGPYLAGSQITHADFTWYPTTIFMEFMLPRVFGWPAVFHETEHFPRLTAWWQKCTENPAFAEVRKDIWDFWETKYAEGQFDSIKDELKDPRHKWVYP